MDLKLSSAKEHLVLENQKLVYYQIQQMGIERNSSNYDDIVSIGTIGLIKAAIAFDSSKKIRFSTYATKCIKNEILLYFRKYKKYANDLSLENELIDYDNYTLGDTIIDTSINFIEEIEQDDYFIYILSIALNCLRNNEKVALLYSLTNLKQEKIAEIMGTSKSYVSQITIRASSKLKKISDNHIKYEKKYIITKSNGGFWISFSSDSITNFDNILSQVVQDLKQNLNLQNLNVNYNNERISILLPKDYEESYLFLATLIQKLDYYKKNTN